MSRSRDSNRSTNVSDSLLPGTGHTPTYGLNESTEEYTEGKSRWFVVAVCALSACIASLVTGMSLSFSSILINELADEDGRAYTDDWEIIPDSGRIASLIGVSSLSKMYTRSGNCSIVNNCELTIMGGWFIKEHEVLKCNAT